MFSVLFDDNFYYNWTLLNFFFLKKYCWRILKKLSEMCTHSIGDVCLNIIFQLIDLWSPVISTPYFLMHISWLFFNYYRFYAMNFKQQRHMKNKLKNLYQKNKSCV